MNFVGTLTSVPAYGLAILAKGHVIVPDKRHIVVSITTIRAAAVPNCAIFVSKACVVLKILAARLSAGRGVGFKLAFQIALPEVAG